MDLRASDVAVEAGVAARAATTQKVINGRLRGRLQLEDRVWVLRHRVLELGPWTLLDIPDTEDQLLATIRVVEERAVDKVGLVGSLQGELVNLRRNGVPLDDVLREWSDNWQILIMRAK